MPESRWPHGGRRPSVEVMTDSRIAVVTGANQGLGLALVEGLARRLGSGARVLLTGRDPGRVAAAVTALNAPTVEGRVLDVTSTAAVEALAAELGTVDIVFANATAPMSPDSSAIGQSVPYSRWTSTRTAPRTTEMTMRLVISAPTARERRRSSCRRPPPCCSRSARRASTDPSRAPAP